jgi:tRNA pseudouridine38-40 synthase
MPRIRLTLEYDGTEFVGWQRQLNGRSVQTVVEAALAELLGVWVHVVAAGRTDSGVHALGQVVAFDAPRPLPAQAYLRGLTGLLPPDVAVVAAAEAPEGFDPRRWATGKRYRYSVTRRASRSPLLRRTHWELFGPLDVEAMRTGAAALDGTHDFTSFRAADCETDARRTPRTVQLSEADEALHVELGGAAFLAQCATSSARWWRWGGEAPSSWIAEVLAARDRTLAGPSGAGARADAGRSDLRRRATPPPATELNTGNRRIGRPALVLRRDHPIDLRLDERHHLLRGAQASAAGPPCRSDG